ncbi:hypothetical protein DYB30_010401 [Aphanomyces astaci]|uniref:Uncharacterized protein n=1 Tax=Aphanomyces astaci TaxID=112090 RepID=A0A397EGH1_APHAT|nr:hypothetical protein DYB38_003847 [Aphanomyces astaci]RHY79490.1 hypothetical protein DYB30_010401 [Aphanomyces astaci]
MPGVIADATASSREPPVAPSSNALSEEGPLRSSSPRRQLKSIVRRDKQPGSVVDSLKSLLFKPKRRHSVQFTVTQTYMLPPQVATPSSDLYYSKSELQDLHREDAAPVDVPEGTVRVQGFLTVLVPHPLWKPSTASRTTYYVTLKACVKPN